MITSAANAILLASAVSLTIDKITVISLSNSGGEYFRKAITDSDVISSTKTIFTFFIDASEGNDDIVSAGLHGDTATITLNSGTCYATQALIKTKTAFDSLTIDWTLEVI